MQYICYIWKYNHNNTAILSRDNESLENFKKRVKEIYSYSEDYHHRFSEFKEIY